MLGIVKLHHPRRPGHPNLAAAGHERRPHRRDDQCMLAPFLFGLQQLGGECRVLGGAGRARGGAREGVHLDPAVLDPQQPFGGRGDEAGLPAGDAQHLTGGKEPGKGGLKTGQIEGPASAQPDASAQHRLLQAAQSDLVEGGLDQGAPVLAVLVRCPGAGAAPASGARAGSPSGRGPGARAIPSSGCAARPVPRARAWSGSARPGRRG